MFATNEASGEAVLSSEKFTSSTPRPYVEQESTSTMAADPIVQYMSRKQLEKSIERTKKLMQEAAKKLDFIEAAQYRDEVLKMEELLKEKDEIRDFTSFSQIYTPLLLLFYEIEY